jgi:hypothetical protein
MVNGAIAALSLGCWLGFGIIAAAQEPAMSAAEIAAAIADGTKTKKPQSYIFTAGNDETYQFWVAMLTPYGRVAQAAADASSKYQPFSADQITSEMTAPVLEIRAVPGKPKLYSSGWELTAPATHMVLRRKGADSVVQPKEITTFPWGWTNAVGGKFEGRGVFAKFDLASVPPGDLEIVVVTERYERVITIKAKDRSKIR